MIDFDFIRTKLVVFNSTLCLRYGEGQRAFYSSIVDEWIAACDQRDTSYNWKEVMKECNIMYKETK